MELLAVVGFLIVGLGFALDSILGGDKSERASGCFSGCMVVISLVCIVFLAFLGWVMQ